MKNTLSYLLASLALITLTACEGTRLPPVFRVNIQQGNILTQDMLTKLQPGMTHEQVRYLLGNPVLVDHYHPERWNYVYTLQLGHHNLEKDYWEQFITIVFDAQGRYSHYEGQLLADALTDPEEDRSLQQRVKNRRREIQDEKPNGDLLQAQPEPAVEPEP